MNQKQIVKNMTIQLDWNAREYERYTDLEVKELIAKEFKTEVRAFNSLLRGMYKKVNYEILFPSKIENYIIIRKCENWE